MSSKEKELSETIASYCLSWVTHEQRKGFLKEILDWHRKWKHNWWNKLPLRDQMRYSSGEVVTSKPQVSREDIEKVLGDWLAASPFRSSERWEIEKREKVDNLLALLTGKPKECPTCHQEVKDA